MISTVPHTPYGITITQLPKDVSATVGSDGKVSEINSRNIYKID